MRAHWKVTDWQTIQMSTGTQGQEVYYPQTSLYLKSLYLDWRFAEEGPTHLMYISFKYKILPCKNLTFLTINVVTGKKNKSFKTLIILKHLHRFPPPNFPFSLEQMSISMETTARKMMLELMEIFNLL